MNNADQLLRIWFPNDWQELHYAPVDGYPPYWSARSWWVTYDGEAFITSRDPVTDSHEPLTVEELPPIKDYIRQLAGYRCVRCGHPYPPGIAKNHPNGQWTPCDWQCTHGGPTRWVDGVIPEGGLPHGEAPEPEKQAEYRILTVHHLNGVKHDCRWHNLAALCQRCHLTIQGRVMMERVYPFEHTDWFKPYAAGYYASVYLNEELTREQTMSRLDELLALERQA